MSDESLKLIKEALTQIALRDEAAITKGLESVEELPEEFYQELDEKVKKKIKGYEKHVSLKKAITAAIVAAVILASFSLSALAFGEEIKGFIIEFFDGFARLTASDGDLNHVDARNISIGYIPEGFSQTKNTGSDSGGLRVWSSENKSITLIYSQDSGTSFVDTEHFHYTTVEINGFTVFRAEYNGQLHSLWTDGKLVYSLSGIGLEWEEMAKIIEGISLDEVE